MITDKQLEVICLSNGQCIDDTFRIVKRDLAMIEKVPMFMSMFNFTKQKGKFIGSGKNF